MFVIVNEKMVNLDKLKYVDWDEYFDREDCEYHKEYTLHFGRNQCMNMDESEYRELVKKMGKC